MAKLSNTTQLDVANKMSLSVLSSSDSKNYFEELYAWKPQLDSDDLFAQQIVYAADPTTADTNVATYPTILAKLTDYQLDEIPASNGQGYSCYATPGDTNSTRLIDFVVPQKYGAGYSFSLKEQDNTVINLTDGQYQFDYANGIVRFDPAATPAVLGYTMPLKITVYRYIGLKGSVDAVSSEATSEARSVADRAESLAQLSSEGVSMAQSEITTNNSLADEAASIARVADSESDVNYSIAKGATSLGRGAESEAEEARSIALAAESQGILDHSIAVLVEVRASEATSIAERSASLARESGDGASEAQSEIEVVRSIAVLAASYGSTADSVSDLAMSFGRAGDSVADIAQSMARLNESELNLHTGLISEANSEIDIATSLAREGGAGSLAASAAHSEAEIAKSIALAAESQGTLDHSIAILAESFARIADSIGDTVEDTHSIALKAEEEASEARSFAVSLGAAVDTSEIASYAITADSVADVANSKATRAESLARLCAESLATSVAISETNSTAIRAESLGSTAESVAALALSFAVSADSVSDRCSSIADLTGRIPPNLVIVDPNAPVIAGERYQTWSAADTYVQTQTPSSSNRWGIQITGANSEAIIVRSWITLVGIAGATRLTGAIDSAGPYTGTNLEYLVIESEITNLSLTGTNAVLLQTCSLTGGTPSGGRLQMSDSFVTGGDYSSIALGPFISHSTVMTSTFPSSFNAEYSSVLASTLDGGNFTYCNLVANTYTSGNYYSLNSCSGAIVLTVTTGNSATISQSDMTGSVTVDLGGTLTTRSNSSNISISNSGTWDNYGDEYDNTTSGLTATEVQGAIDEIAVGTVGSASEAKSIALNAEYNVSLVDSEVDITMSLARSNSQGISLLALDSEIVSIGQSETVSLADYAVGLASLAASEADLANFRALYAIDESSEAASTGVRAESLARLSADSEIISEARSIAIYATSEANGAESIGLKAESIGLRAESLARLVDVEAASEARSIAVLAGSEVDALAFEVLNVSFAADDALKDSSDAVSVADRAESLARTFTGSGAVGDSTEAVSEAESISGSIARAADGKANALSKEYDITASTANREGYLVYMTTTDDEIALARADAEATMPAFGVITHDGDTYCNVKAFSGRYDNVAVDSTADSVISGSPVFISLIEAGKITDDVPGTGVIQKIGVATRGDLGDVRIHFDAEPAITL